MMTIFETFCGGLAFAAGALFSCLITAKLGASVWSKRHADLLEMQSRAEERLATQVQLLATMSRALEQALATKNEALETSS